MQTRIWNGYWINNDRTMGAPNKEVGKAPYLRKSFICQEQPKHAVIYLCALGWHELYVNGQKADDRVLAPVVTQFEKRDSYIAYDVTSLLQAGQNAVTVLLGNGWYNCHTAEVWSFDKAPWRDWPKLICDIVADGKLVATSDCSWRYHDSPIVFDALRNGETYDARLEIPGVFNADFDDSDWAQATQITPPGGVLVEEELEPCKVQRSYAPVKHWSLEPNLEVYDFGTNLTGWCQLTVQGAAGTGIKIAHTEFVKSKDELFGNHLNAYVIGGDFQTDRYILKGQGEETFHPHFTYHGFRYACVSFSEPEKARLCSIQAQFIHNDFQPAGSFESSSEPLNRLNQITRQSYLSNFTGIPTDCPHREKNGWTGDAQVACETGLWNFQAKNAYRHFLQLMADDQRPCGQFPGIVPSGGWGYNWGSGPAWDSMFFEGCYQIYRFTGDKSPILDFYQNLKRYLDYCLSMSENYLIRFGLGDWCHCNPDRMAPVEVTSTGYFYIDTIRMAFFAKVAQQEQDRIFYEELAEKIRVSFTEKYYHGDGIWSNDTMTALAAPLFFGLAKTDQQKTADRLAELVRKNDYKVDFGMLGAKYVPRVLADYGYADVACKLLTQPEFPGWGFFLAQGATTLWENWSGSESQDHILFGDVSAWMYEYLAGVTPLAEAPGFKEVILHPAFVQELDHVSMTHETPLGTLKVRWERKENSISYHVELPHGCIGKLRLPNLPETNVTGSYDATITL